MRNSLIKVGLFSVLLILMAPVSVGALKLDDFSITADPVDFKIEKLEPKPIDKEAAREVIENTGASAPAVETTQPPQINHTVVGGENLSKIAEMYQTTWVRLFAKNTQIENPNILKIGDVLTIPQKDEVLTERPVIEIEPVQSSNGYIKTSSPRRTAGNKSSITATAGNTYAPGYCTWYAKNRRPDLPNRMGNAISWVSSAASSGFTTGSSPRVGAIGQQGNHVVYVESVNGDGTVTVSEMNYVGLGIVSSRTVSASNFIYIY